MFLRLQSLVSKFSSAVNNQKPRVDQLDEDTDNLLKDMNTLNEKVSSRIPRIPSRFIDKISVK